MKKLITLCGVLVVLSGAAFGQSYPPSSFSSVNLAKAPTGSGVPPAVRLFGGPPASLTDGVSGSQSVVWQDSLGNLQGFLQGAFPAATPWSAMPLASVRMGHTLPLVPGDSGYGTTTYLGMPYGPELGGLDVQGANSVMAGTTYGWSAAGHMNDLLTVWANGGTTGFRGTEGYQNYASRLSYGQADSHAVTISNRSRGVAVTLTGLTAANFTTDSSVPDPTVSHSYIYRVTGTLTSTQVASLVPGDTVFTSNGYMAFIVKADTGGVDVDNWTRGAANVTVNGNCLQHGPSVQPTAVSDTNCTQDIATAGTLTAYIGTQSTSESLYLLSTLLPASSSPLASYQRIGEMALLNDSYTLPTWNDAVPLLDFPSLGGFFGGASAENRGSSGSPAAIGSNGVGVYGFGMLFNGGVRRGYVVDTSTLAPPNYPYTAQPYCGFCITSNSTVHYGYLDQRSDTSGYVLLATTGYGGANTTIIDKNGNMSESGQVSADHFLQTATTANTLAGSLAVGSLSVTGATTNLGSQTTPATFSLGFHDTGSATPDALIFSIGGTAGTQGGAELRHVATTTSFFDKTNAGGLRILTAASGNTTLQTTGGSLSLQTNSAQNAFIGTTHGNQLIVADNGATIASSLQVMGAATGSAVSISVAGTPAQIDIGNNGPTGSGVGFNGATADLAYGRVVATTGGSDTIPNNSGTRLLDPAATIAAFTETLPAAPVDGQLVEVLCGQTITALTVNANSGQTIRPSGTSLATTCSAAPGGRRSFRYFSVLAAWVPM